MRAALLLAALVAAAYGQGTKGGKEGAASSNRPFYGKKQPEESKEAALPAFVEPPPAPNPEPNDAPSEPGMPYSFSYTADATNGMSARQESSDGSVVRGSYMLEGPDGISRVVHYIADKDGFRATISTNEPGTESMAPSGVILTSSQLPASEIALQYGPGEPIRRQPEPSIQAAPIIAAPVAPIPAPIPVQPIAAPAPLIPAAPFVPAQPIREAALSAPTIPRAPIAQRLAFGTRQEVRQALPSARNDAVKGGPPPARKAPPPPPVKAPPRPLAPPQIPVVFAPAKAPPRPIQPVVFAPVIRAPLPPPPPVPAPLPIRPVPVQPIRAQPLPVVRAAGKVTLQRNPRPFFIPTTTTTEAPQFVFDEQQQQQEQVQEEQVRDENVQQEQQQQHEEEPEPAQQQQIVVLDEPQFRQLFGRA